MITNSLIVIPSFDTSLEICDFVYQTSLILSRKNDVVIINPGMRISVKKAVTYFRQPNTPLNSPVISFLPFQKSFYFNRLNLILTIVFLTKIIYRKRIYSQKILWIFFPWFAYLIKPFRSWFILYDAVDFHSSLGKKIDHTIMRQTKSLLKSTNLITAISHSLKDRLGKLSNRRIHVVPQGFHLTHNNPHKKTSLNLKTLTKNNFPIVGFIGGIGARINYHLMQKTIKALPKINFIFIGPKKFNHNVKTINAFHGLTSLPNFYWLDTIKKNDLAKVVNQFTICAIPYDCDNEFNRLSYPMKLFEYFYCGKPVISTPITELYRFPDLVMIGKNSQEWINHIKFIRKHGWSDRLKTQQRKLALQNSWMNKIEKISSLIES